MNILLTIFFENNIPLQAYYDHFYTWLCKNLPNANIKILMIEKYFNENQELHLLDALNPILLKNDEIANIFNTTNFYEIYEKIHFTKLSNEEISNLSQLTKNKLKNWEPDVIITQGFKSSFKIYSHIFPNALCLTQENAIFSRPPFLRTLSYDPYNSVPDNFPVSFAEDIRQFEITQEQNKQIENLKNAITGIVDKYNKLDNEMLFYYKQKFDKLVLLPLVGDKYITLFKDCIYNTELELVEKVMQKTPKNVGIFITQADAYASLTEENIEYFSNKYPNFIYLKKTDKRGYANNSLNYFKYIDAIFNITSKTGFMAMLWDKPVLSLAKLYNNWYKDGQGLKDVNTVLNTPYKNKNNILYWYFTRYVLFEQDFSKENFLYNFITTKLQKYRTSGITFDFFDEINSIEKIFDFILQPVIKYYETQDPTKQIISNVNELQTKINNVKQENLNAINNYVQQNDNNISELYNRIDRLANENKQIIIQINNLNQRLNKPTFLQQIFSVKNENRHKIIRILGIKIRIRRK